MKTNNVATLRLAAIREAVAALEAEEQAIYRASVEAPADEKVCDDKTAKMFGEEEMSRFMWPIEVHGISYSGETVGQALFTRTKPGTWVAVRPCDDEHKGKTFLGIYIGDLALSQGARFNRATCVLELVLGMHNPAMWVPDLQKIVFGAGSWWGEIKSPDDMRKITNADIENTWYVQAMRALADATPAAPASDGASS